MSNNADQVADGKADGMFGWSDQTWAFLILRIWLAVRAIITGLLKFYGRNAVNEWEFGLQHYHAIPKALETRFAAAPIFSQIPPAISALFYGTLGYVLILAGVMTLIGLGTRISLVLQGLLYVALTFGLILINQDAGIAWLGIHILLIAFALVLAKHNRLAVLKKW